MKTRGIMTITDIIDENFGFLKRNGHIFLDFPAGTPISPEALDSLNKEYIDCYANPSSNNLQGEFSNKKFQSAKAQLTKSLNLDSHQIIFTSGSTEAINLGIQGYYKANYLNGKRIITSRLEHKATLNTFEHLETLGADVQYVHTTSEGGIDLEHLGSLINDSTILVSIMHVNNETGVINPICKIQDLLENHQATLFSDTTQSIGKIAFDYNSIDMFCFSAHKIHGPKGVGALVLKKDINITPISYGGSQENGLRPGTINLPSIISSTVALTKNIDNLLSNFNKALLLQSKFEEQIISCSLGKVNCKKAKRSPYISSICLNQQSAVDFMMINRNKYSVSNGSACNESSIQPSHVLTEIYIDKIEIENSIRIGIPISDL